MVASERKRPWSNPGPYFMDAWSHRGTNHPALRRFVCMHETARLNVTAFDILRLACRRDKRRGGMQGANFLILRKGWAGEAIYSNGFKLPLSSLATSGDFRGFSPSQSKQRNLRPPLLTSTKCVGLLQFGQRGGGVFLAMVYSR
jgi:hypothetical protein